MNFSKQSLCGVLQAVPEPDVNDERWEEAGVVEKLFMYPLKSCAGTKLNEANVDKFGLTDGKGLRDRQFMVIDAKNRFVTGRQQPKLVLIRVQVQPDSNQLRFTALGTVGALVVDFPDITDQSLLIETQVFGQRSNGYDLGPEAGQWITDFLATRSGGSYKIIYNPYDAKDNPDGNIRQNPIPNPELFPVQKPDDTCLYADGFGFLLVTTGSIQGLNEKLRERGKGSIDERNVRPNIYVKNNGGPFEEDDWLFVKIDGVIFRISAWCARCIMTTVDPDRGTKNPDMEPLRTLRTFRLTTDKRELKMLDKAPYFGVNLGIDNPKGDTIHVGDKVYVIKKKPVSSWLGSGVVSAVMATSVLALAFVIRNRFVN